MKQLITGGLVALALSATTAAQDSTVKSNTKVSGDDAKAVVMRGCLQQTAAGNGFLLLGAVTQSGDNLQSKSKVKTDVDDDKTTVKGKTTTKIDDDDHAVATSGSSTAYAVTPRGSVDLAAHAGEEVEISAVMVEAGKGDADVKIEDKTKIDRDDGPDTKVESKTKAEVDRGPMPQIMAMSVKSLGRSCNVR